MRARRGGCSWHTEGSTWRLGACSQQLWNHSIFRRAAFIASFAWLERSPISKRATRSRARMYPRRRAIGLDEPVTRRLIGAHVLSVRAFFAVSFLQLRVGLAQRGETQRDRAQIELTGRHRAAASTNGPRSAALHSAVDRHATVNCIIVVTDQAYLARTEGYSGDNKCERDGRQSPSPATGAERGEPCVHANR